LSVKQEEKSNLYNLAHLVVISPWPWVIRMCGLSLTSSFVFWFKLGGAYPMFVCIFFILVCMWVWWRDVGLERRSGVYSALVVDGLKIGIILFILREVCFFAAFFWCFFHSSLCPTWSLGGLWPPLGIFGFNPFRIPLLNTLVLLSSGLTVTWSHHQLIRNKGAFLSLLLTILLGAYFTFLQGFEYYTASFSIIDSVYGRIFFVATGFHGLHVLIGTSFLLVCLFRLYKFNFNSLGLLGYEIAIWYWHFVDVVWLFLYSFVYFWGFLYYGRF